MNSPNATLLIVGPCVTSARIPAFPEADTGYFRTGIYQYTGSDLGESGVRRALSAAMNVPKRFTFVIRYPSAILTGPKLAVRRNRTFVSAMSKRLRLMVPPS